MKSKRAVAIALLLLFIGAAAVYLLYRQGMIPSKEGQPTDVSYDGTVTILDVGQASCTVIESKGEYALIDAGHADGGSTDIVSYLSERGVGRIKILILTHFHYDHTSDVLDIMKTFGVDTIVIPRLSEENTPTSSFYRLLLENRNKGQYEIKFAHMGDTYSLGDGEIKIINETYNGGTANDTSIITTFTLGDAVYLDTGDAGVDVELMNLDLVPKNVSLYDSGHHGSSESNGHEFLKKIRPKMTVFSCGKDNEFHHPHPSVTRDLIGMNCSYLVTYEYGNVVYSLKEDRLLKEVH